jgi:hypothetical protein
VQWTPSGVLARFRAAFHAGRPWFYSSGQSSVIRAERWTYQVDAAGEAHDIAVYSIVEPEWPGVREHLLTLLRRPYGQ